MDVYGRDVRKGRARARVVSVCMFSDFSYFSAMMFTSVV